MSKKIKRSAELKVGITVVVALAIFVALIFSTGECQLFHRGYTITVIFDSAAGLVTEAKVLYAGVRAGSVESVEWFKPEGSDSPMVKVILRLEEDVVVRENSVIAIRLKGLMADKYVDITPGTSDSPVVPPGSTVKGERSIGMDELFESAGSIVIKIGDALADLSNLFDEETVAQIKDTIVHIDSMATDLDELIKLSTGEITAAVRNLRQITDNVSQITASASRITQDFEGTLARSLPRFESAVASIEEVASGATLAVDHINSIVAQIASGEGTVGKLIYSDEAYVDFTETLKKAKTLLDNIIEDPRRYLNLSVF
ncbi:MAG TPA: MlaD family protein [bacterium]|nr:MlaD family protein [bacterium]